MLNKQAFGVVVAMIHIRLDNWQLDPKKIKYV